MGIPTGQRPEVAFSQSIVQLPGTALKIEVLHFLEAARRSGAIKEIAAQAQQVWSINLQRSAACNALHELEQRLARWLLHSRDRFDGKELPLSHGFLSQMLGVRRTTVSLAARTLQNAGVISYRRGKIQITDLRGLETVSCDCYRMVNHTIEAMAVTEKATNES